MNVRIIDTGVANLASIAGALAVLGVETSWARDAESVRTADAVVLPGVGHFEAGIGALHELGILEAVREWVLEGRPLFAICLGLQLLCTGSDESPQTPGIGAIEAHVRPLPDFVRVPHLGWNRIAVDPGEGYLTDGVAAFANSYGISETPAGWRGARTFHGAPFLAAVERGRVVGCQFHPELSGGFGLGLLRRWLADEPISTPSSASSMSLDELPAGPVSRIIPCLDVRHGRVVKGVRFQDLRDAGDPAECAAAYAAQGADEIVVLDIAASPEARGTSLETVERVRAALQIPLTVGGGVRRVGDACELLSRGADKVAVNSAAVLRPELLRELAARFGRQCVVLAVDARRQGESWEVLVQGGREATALDAIEWIREGVRAGAGEVLLTSWDRDGTREGCDVELLDAATSAVSVPVIASGGVGTPRDVLEALGAGADAVLAASIFHDGDHTVHGVKDTLRSKGYRVRT